MWSPDHTKHILLWSTPWGPRLSIYSAQKDLQTIILDDLSAGTFVKWSSDSKGFYLMWSDGGYIGGYHVRALLVTGDSVIESPAPKTVAEEFAKYHYCGTRGNNLYAIRWVNGAQQLLLQPEVYPTSDCGQEMGFTSGYLANTASGRILKRYTAQQMKQIADGCPSDVFPNAFTTQQEIDDYRKSKEGKPH